MQSARYACIESLGVDSLAALSAQTLLGIALRSTGRPGQGEPHFLEALEGLNRRFGEFSAEALACRLGYAANLLSLDRGADAEREIGPVLAVYQERLGPTHPHTLVCLLNLASARRLTGDSAARCKRRTQPSPACGTCWGRGIRTRWPR